MNTANMPPRRIEKNVMVRRGFIMSLGSLNVPHIFPQEGRPAPSNPLLVSVAMPQPALFRFLLLAALAVIAAFLALAIAVPIEPQVPSPLLALFSPGLKLAGVYCECSPEPLRLPPKRFHPRELSRFPLL